VRADYQSGAESPGLSSLAPGRGGCGPVSSDEAGGEGETVEPRSCCGIAQHEVKPALPANGPQSDHMDITLPLDQMTFAEKLRVMEALWADLCRNEQDLQSPAWHEQVLKERDERVRSGQEAFMDWETAKQQLRARLK